ncbi:MAG: hypothetical protein JRJ87_16490, partial [Deltaproteobacteria bacterium]|nr:hypothetical protein [Deltaproteobacteria bacterium]
MPNPPEEAVSEKRDDWAITDLINKTLIAGAGALFMTEEGVRSFLGDLKLPKEVVQYMVAQVSKTKEDLFRILSLEIRQFLESTNLADEVRRVLSSTSLEISTTVRFVPNNDNT